jgi:alpha-mannosidase
MGHPCRASRPPVPLVSYQLKQKCAGITGGCGGDRRVEYIIPRDARNAASVTHSFVAEATCNGMFGVPWNETASSHPMLVSSLLLTHVEALTRLQPNRYIQLASVDFVVPNTASWSSLGFHSASRVTRPSKS